MKTKNFKFTIKAKSGQILAQEIATFGTEERSFPDNWKENGMCLKALEDHKENFLYRMMDITVEEGDELDDF